MNINLLHGINDIACDVIILPWYTSESMPEHLGRFDTALSSELSTSLEKGHMKGKAGEVTVFHTYGLFASRKLLLVGMGDQSKLDRHTLRKALHTAFKCCLRDETVAIDLKPLVPAFTTGSLIHEITTSLFSASYTFDTYQKMPEKTPSTISTLAIIVEAQTPEMDAALHEAVLIGNAVNLARDLVNTPANFLTPALFAQKAEIEAQKTGFSIKILEDTDMQQLGMEALLSVSRGSTEPPKFLVMEHNAHRADLPTVVLAGKGVTFDSGGISIKPSRNMHIMKTDMAGAAAVLGTMSVISQLGLLLHVVGLTPLTENMPDGHATRPGDIVTAMNGKSIEILNTDAEGRLILADALSYAERFKPEYMIDLATLTGACIVALGHEAAAVLGNSPDLIQLLKQASGQCDERIWELPIWDEYREDMKSDIADIANIGKSGTAGTIEGAVFLEAFAGTIPWAHLDIAGVSDTTSSRFYSIPGATGFGVALLVQFLKLAAAEKHDDKGSETASTATLKFE